MHRIRLDTSLPLFYLAGKYLFSLLGYCNYTPCKYPCQYCLPVNGPGFCQVSLDRTEKNLPKGEAYEEPANQSGCLMTHLSTSGRFFFLPERISLSPIGRSYRTSDSHLDFDRVDYPQSNIDSSIT